MATNPPRYFAPRYFAGRYFGAGEEAPEGSIYATATATSSASATLTAILPLSASAAGTSTATGVISTFAETVEQPATAVIGGAVHHGPMDAWHTTVRASAFAAGRGAMSAKATVISPRTAKASAPPKRILTHDIEDDDMVIMAFVSAFLSQNNGSGSAHVIV